MKALAIDCAVARLVIAAKNEEKTCTCVYNLGMKQSEILVPSIEYVLSKADLQPADLDYTTLTLGPGSFTGLRLGISALKAFNLAYRTPLYGIPTLKAYEYTFLDFGLPVVTGIDANKDKFFARIIDKNQKELLKDDDYELDQLLACVKAFDTIIAAGPDCLKLKAAIKSKLPSVKIITANTSQATTDALFELAEKEKTAGTPPMQDYDGPVYLRASEAERKLS